MWEVHYPITIPIKMCEFGDFWWEFKERSLNSVRLFQNWVYYTPGRVCEIWIHNPRRGVRRAGSPKSFHGHIFSEYVSYAITCTRTGAASYFFTIYIITYFVDSLILFSFMWLLLFQMYIELHAHLSYCFVSCVFLIQIILYITRAAAFLGLWLM